MSEHRADLRQELLDAVRPYVTLPQAASDWPVVVSSAYSAKFGRSHSERMDAARLAMAGVITDALLPVIDRHVQAERERIAAAIWDDEQKCQSAIVDDPTSFHLNGRLAGLQRARDIARWGDGGTDE